MSAAFNPGDVAPTQSEAESPDIPQWAGETHRATTAVAEDIPKHGKCGMLRLFRVRNFTLLFAGQTISTIGDALYAVALPWMILTTGGGARELGTVLTAYGIPRVGSMLLGGWLSDRLRPRQVMLIADVLRVGLLGWLAALALLGHPTLLQLCVVAALLGALGGAFLPASMAVLPDILSDDALQAGNATFLTSMQGANLVGSVLAGGVVAAYTAGVGLALDAVTFCVSAVSLALMRQAHGAVRNKSGQEESRANLSGSRPGPGTPISFWRFLYTSRLIQVILLLDIVAGFCVSGLLEVALPTLVHGPLRGGAGGYGAILAAWGTGALVGGILAGTLGGWKHKGLIMLGSGLIMSAALALLPAGGVAFAVVCMLIGGVANSMTSVLFFTVVQTAIPRHLMGRVMGLLMFSSLGMYPLSVALAGVLSNQFGPAILFPFSGLALALVMVVGMTQRTVRSL